MIFSIGIFIDIIQMYHDSWNKFPRLLTFPFELYCVCKAFLGDLIPKEEKFGSKQGKNEYLPKGSKFDSKGGVKENEVANMGRKQRG